MTNGNAQNSNCLGLILAGGKSSRMTNCTSIHETKPIKIIDKSFIKLGEISLIQRTINKLQPQIRELVISANSAPDKFSSFNLPVIKDTIEGNAGPLAGVLSAMRWAQANKPLFKTIISVAVDTPFFPTNYVDRMLANHQNNLQITIANSNGRNHPVFAMWNIDLADDLEKFLIDEGNRKVMMFAQRYKYEIQEFHDKTGIDPFFNINTYVNLTQAQSQL